MLKASNNYFDDRSKIKLLEIRQFCDFKSAKIASKLMPNKVIISQNMLEFKIFLNIYKIIKK